MSSSNFNMRLDNELKAKAFPILESYGLSAAQAFKLFLTQVAETKTVPLSFDWQRSHTPNEETIAAIQEAIAEQETAKKYDTIEDALKDMQGE